jgi:hypothetical protein
MVEEKEEQIEITPDIYLLKGLFPELKTMKKNELQEECKMWRNIWDWIPHEVKYYVARTGQLVAITMRNYKRYMGKLLETHWDVKEIELGVEDVVYDTKTGQRFFERKTIRVGMGGIIDFQIIYDRKSEQELLAEGEEEEEQSTEYTQKDSETE